MLLGEPPRTGGDLNFQLFGIPVRVHPLFWLIAVLLGISGDPQPAEILLWVVAVFVSILVHELGHALTMRAFGMWPWITLTGFGGLASSDPGDSQRIGTGGQVLISFAGPGSQFLLVAVLASVLRVAGYSVVLNTDGFVPLVLPGQQVVSWGVTVLLFNLMLISVYWGVLNLVPVYPLDGGQIARELLVAASPRNGISQSLMLSIASAIVVTLVALQNKATFLAIMFGLLAYGSYQMLQAYRNQRGW